MESSPQLDLNALSDKLKISANQVSRTIELLDDGNTLPFITRFRRDQTGGLDESQIREIRDQLNRVRSLADRKDTIIKSIRARGELTDQLEKQINAADSIKLVEDFYLPFKRKKETRSSRARQRGLEPLADEILAGTIAVDQFDSRATEFLKPDEGLAAVKDVLDGVKDILAEKFSERIDVRQCLRKFMSESGVLTTVKYVEMESKDDEEANSNESADAKEKESSEKTDAEASPTAEQPGEGEPGEGEPAAASTNGSDVATDKPAASEATATDESSSENPGSDAPSNDAEKSDDDANIQPPQDDSDKDAVSDSKSDEVAATEIPAEGELPEKVFPASEAKSPEKAAAARIVKLPAAAVTAEQRRAQRREARRRKREQLESSFKNYFDYSESIDNIPPHRILAINRGERVRVLRVRLKVETEALYQKCRPILISENHPQTEYLESCVRDSLSRMLIPSLDREIRRDLTENAEQHALSVFARNLRQLLLQPPVRKRVLAIDPGLRYGCKAAALDEYGNLLDDTTIHALGDADRVAEGRRRMKELIAKHKLQVIAIGNGTGCRQAETTVATLLEKELKDHDVSYVIVNEAGASVYSTGQVAGQELPDADVRLRGAISIGRRLLDPLSELVKIDPGNIGVGLYQHDVKLKHLQKSLDDVVQSCVNYVGVNLNTASPSLLRYVSGLNQRTAREIYDHRQKNGPFVSREQLKEVAGVGDATFVQAAGFLKVHSGDTPLDATWVHPESYESAKKVLDDLDCTLDELAAQVRKYAEVEASETIENTGTETTAATSQPATAPEASNETQAEAETAKNGEASSETVTPTNETTDASADAGQPTEPSKSEAEKPTETATATQPAKATPAADEKSAKKSGNGWLTRWEKLNAKKMAEDLGIGSFLFDDLVASLRRPGRDPREDFPAPIFRRGIMKLEDLQADMELSATVLNVVDFGAFVDIGLRDSGLIHISQLADQFIRDPHELVSVGDILRVWVMEVDKRRRRVSLTAIPPGTPRQNTQEQKPKTSKPPRRRNEGKRKRDSGSGGGGEKSKRRTSAPPRRRKPKPPAVPITDGMKEGSEPMRTFGDLAQFFQGRDDGDKKKK